MERRTKQALDFLIIFTNTPLQVSTISNTISGDVQMSTSPLCLSSERICDMGMIIEMAGGLGLFLFGMSIMSESIEKVAGAKLRRILEIFTSNRFMGIIVGIVFTGIIQSSSACTAMVVSFVNAGLMNLYQAAGVILGANIGTTVTSQLVSFNLSAVAPVILLFGVLITMFCKKQNIKEMAGIIIGFGILFVGLNTMKDAMSAVRDVKEVTDILMSLKNPLLAILVGTVLTSIIQSSSVTVSIVLLMASQDLLELPITLYIILGCNIGACTTALLASLSGKKDAKRAALIHFWFNVIGTIMIYIVLQFAMEPVIALIGSISSDNGRFVANAHTIIKIVQVIVMIPFIKPLVKLASVCVPGQDEKVFYREDHQLKYIGEKVVFNPATAVVEVVKEMDRMASLAAENLNRAMNALITLDEEDIEEVYKVEENINFLNHAITEYLVKINQSPLPIEDLKSIGGLFHVVNDIERIGDHAENVADAARSRKQSGVAISKEAQKELGEMLDMVNTIVRYAVDMFVKDDDSHMQEIIDLENRVDELERALQQAHVTRLTKGECTPEAGMIFADVISGLERVADHATNIAFAIHSQEESEGAAVTH